VLVWGAPYLGLAAEELAPDTLMAFEKAIAGGVRDAAPSLTVSRAGSAAMSLQGSAEAIDQSGPGEGLGQEANCSGLQRSVADTLIWEGRDENERHTITLGAQRR
jgi:hypothetical protein